MNGGCWSLRSRCQGPAVERGDAAAAREWCGKHVRDYRRGFEVAGIDLALPIKAGSARRAGRRRAPPGKRAAVDRQP